MSKTVNKYYKFMCTLHDMKKFDAKKMTIEHQVSSQVIAVMREAHMIQKYPGDKATYWVGDIPTMSDASRVLAKCQHKIRASRISKAALPPQQLTIKPIKRVERTQPVPVQQEPIHDTSNSKMLIIMAVGTILGFLIATLIWK